MRLWLVAVCLLSPGGMGAWAAGARELPAARTMHAGLRDLDLSVGYASNLQLPPSPDRTDVRFITVMGRFGWFQTHRNELLLEVPYIFSAKPGSTRSGGGLNGIFRHHFSARRDLAPFFDIGVGFLVTNIRVKELGGEFQFTPQAGVGLRLPSGGDADILAGLRFHHISNGGLRRPNVGLNSLLLTIGFSRLF